MLAVIRTQRLARLGGHSRSPLIITTFLSSQKPIMRFFTAGSTRSNEHYKAIVVGAGPAGVAVVGNLLEQNQAPLLWIDHEFQGGRLNKHYREVPSNTKAKLFVDFAQAVEPLSKITKETPSPNAFTTLQELDQSKGCPIARAADLCVMLTEGLDTSKDVWKKSGNVVAASWCDTKKWTVELTPVEDSDHVTNVSSDMLVLCTGSSPSSGPLPVPLREVSLDVALKPSLLAQVLNPGENMTFAVIGASHSAILVLRNLCNLATTSHPNLRIKWFTRHELRYAEQRDGWIYLDNTGLKGEVAEWARENLEDHALPNSPISKVLEKVKTTKEAEREDYKRVLPECTHVVQAIGFHKDPVPLLSRGEKALIVTHDNKRGGFTDANGHPVKGLYAAGIAWPEKVTDPEGNTSMNVGMWKFMRYLRETVPTWK